MRGKAASNSQAAICSLRTHRLTFTHYTRRPEFPFAVKARIGDGLAPGR
jgi:hypothetical protein